MAFQRIVQDVAPAKGTDVYLAINKNLQMECYKAIGDVANAEKYKRLSRVIQEDGPEGRRR